MWILAIILFLVGLGVPVAIVKNAQKRFSAASGNSTRAMELEISEAMKLVEQALQRSNGFLSKGQLEFLAEKVVAEQSALEAEKTHLKQVEDRLDSAQKQVEERETKQQELKSIKEEEEIKLKGLLEYYQTVSDESFALEKRLAQSLKNLEQMLAEVQMTDAQKAILNELLEALTEAGARLRELLTEYQVVQERLQMLDQQHRDLEEEYTKLVEQQLGA